MDKHGPMEIGDERLSGQLAILPENSQTLIKNFGGLEKFLLSSSAFVKQEGLICLAEYAAVVAASMNTNGSDQDMLMAASSGNNFKSREKDTHGLNYGQSAMGYSLKQKGLNKTGKDGAIKQPSSTGWVASSGKTSHSINNNNTKYESSAKKNISMPQSQRLITPTVGGINNQMTTSGKSTYSDKLSHHNNQGIGKHTPTKYQSVSSGLDSRETPLAFSSTIDRKLSVISSSASTEHSQEVPSIEEDEIIGNLFDYNNFGTGSSNYLSPSTDGFFPNAYPNEQGDTGMLPDIATATTDTETFNKTGKKTVVNEMVVTPDVMNSAKTMKMVNSTALYTFGENVTNLDSTTGSLSNSSVHHMEPVYLPPPPVQKFKDKKNASMMTDQVYIYTENYKEKYEAEVRGRNDLLKRLEDTEDRRVQMSNAHAMELDRAVKQTRNDAMMVSYL